MAEFIESGKKKGKRSTRVDLTPMVDLGFLLITFFIFTTAMSKPTGLKIILPKSTADSLKTPESGVLTFLLSGERRIYYYEGADPHFMHVSSENKVREIILNKKKRTAPDKFMAIIKPGRDSDFHTLVKVMDEMSIDAVKHYAMVDMEPIEYSLMQEK
jgi:Biopolymer transport protein